MNDHANSVHVEVVDDSTVGITMKFTKSERRGSSCDAEISYHDVAKPEKKKVSQQQ